MLRVTPQLEQKKIRQRLKEPNRFESHPSRKLPSRRNPTKQRNNPDVNGNRAHLPQRRDTTSLYCSHSSNETLLKGAFAGGRVAMATVP
ncbi:hypothetical protein TNCT_214051 [Trichonephila clavata]|uniref:Uncharacterized protein n=1 Tax=Trichonephila clavata TaxID=2740835 RepID=A0A8X6HXD1_TRICU|nr:hypothetical protein TNCT_214051 [Trichonephila clavata]